MTLFSRAKKNSIKVSQSSSRICESVFSTGPTLKHWRRRLCYFTRFCRNSASNLVLLIFSIFYAYIFRFKFSHGLIHALLNWHIGSFRKKMNTETYIHIYVYACCVQLDLLENTKQIGSNGSNLRFVEQFKYATIQMRSGICTSSWLNLNLDELLLNSRFASLHFAVQI